MAGLVPAISLRKAPHIFRMTTHFPTWNHHQREGQKQVAKLRYASTELRLLGRGTIAVQLATDAAMGLFDFLKSRDKNRQMLLEMIEHNADIIERDESQPRSEAEYLAICLIIDDLGKRSNGREGYLKVMEILQNEHQRHLNEVVTYVGWSTGKLVFKPEFDAAMRARHSK